MFRLGPLEITVIVVIIVLVFGLGRIGRIGAELGTAIRAFRKNLQGEEKEKKDEPK
jgi:sec-independent protein translocase protein TatA